MTEDRSATIASCATDAAEKERTDPVRVAGSIGSGSLLVARLAGTHVRPG